MRHLHRCNRRLSRLHAVQEVPEMPARGEGQLHLTQILREGTAFLPFLVRGLEGVAAVHPNPAVFRRSTWSRRRCRRMATGDDDLDVARVLAGDPVLGAGVPECVRRRELAHRLDLAGPERVVVSQPPVGDVAVVPNPVEQLAAAGVVVPSPVHVAPGLDIGLHPGRPNPTLVVEPGRGLGHRSIPPRGSGNQFRQIGDPARKRRQLRQQRLSRPGKIMVPGGQPDLHAGDPTHQPVAHDFRAVMARRSSASPVIPRTVSRPSAVSSPVSPDAANRKS
jgi:hypothetical protein